MVIINTEPFHYSSLDSDQRVNVEGSQKDARDDSVHSRFHTNVVEYRVAGHSARNSVLETDKIQRRGSRHQHSHGENHHTAAGDSGVAYSAEHLSLQGEHHSDVPGSTTQY